MKETRPILRRVKNANNHDGFLKRLVKNQIIAERRNDKPADLRVTRRSIADAPAKLRVLGEKISSVENRSPDAFRCVGIVSEDVAENFIQIAPGFWTELRADHDRRNSSVVLACSRFSSPSSSCRSSSGVITTSMP